MKFQTSCIDHPIWTRERHTIWSTRHFNTEYHPLQHSFTHSSILHSFTNWSFVISSTNINWCSPILKWILSLNHRAFKYDWIYSFIHSLIESNEILLGISDETSYVLRLNDTIHYFSIKHFHDPSKERRKWEIFAKEKCHIDWTTNWIRN